ncbi:hypothetical protein BDR26DRAFT_866083 [Obelidium mucronatum]|nr:hypothetical protein BDR26DRAFT_866083 [Obelidium mucronatum]
MSPFEGVKEVLNSLRTQHRLGFYDAIEVLGIFVTLEPNEGKSLNNHIIASLLAIGHLQNANTTEYLPSLPSDQSLIWSLHPLLLATLSKHYYLFFKQYATTLISWTRREFRGMLSLCQTRGDSEFFSAPDYLWVSCTGGEDVNGYQWRPTTGQTSSMGLSSSGGAESMLLKRVEDLKWRWKLLVSMDENLESVVVGTILVKEREWILELVEEAKKSQRRKSLSFDPSPSPETANDGKGGLDSLAVFWVAFFGFIEKKR